MVLPGAEKTPPQFQADMLSCQQQAQAYVAPQADAANNQAAATAVVGTALGAAVGALSGSGYYYYPRNAAAWGAGTGLLFGSTMAAGQSQASSYSLQRRFDIAYMQCMYQLGNLVPGQLAAQRPARAMRPVPAVPAVPPANTPAPNFPPPNTPAPVGVTPPA